MLYAVTGICYGLFAAWLIYKGIHWHDDVLAEVETDE